MGGIFLEEEDEQTKAENDAKRKEFEQEKIDLAKEAEKQKSEDLWAGKSIFYLKFFQFFKRLVAELLCNFTKFLLNQ